MGCGILVLMFLSVVGSGMAVAPRSTFIQRLDPLDLSGTNYYIGGGGGSPAIVEDLRRGQDGLMVKLNDVTRALKEDELKLNNVFYKLGRHDTDLEGVGSSVADLTSNARKIESKLNKHAYNVDFLRRRLESIQSRLEDDERLEVQVATSRAIINRLENRLTDALTRLGMVENTTQTLEKRSAPQYSDLLHLSPLAAARPPTLTVYPEPHQDSCRLDWERVGLGCYWFGGEELTFPEAMAACRNHGGHLLTLPSPGTQLDLLLARLQKNTIYWTSGTDAFDKGDWSFLMTAQPVMPLHWAPGQNSTTTRHSHRCAGVSTPGLSQHKCTHRFPYVCHTV